MSKASAISALSNQIQHEVHPFPNSKGIIAPEHTFVNGGKMFLFCKKVTYAVK
jgi:hypothetical protein